MTEELRAVFDEAAAGMPDAPDRLDRVHERCRRQGQVRSAAAVGATVLAVAGVAVLVPVLRSTPATRPLAAAALGDCAHGGAPLPQDEQLSPLPPPSAGPDGTYARTNRIELRLQPDCTTVRVGQEVTIRVQAVGDAARPIRDFLSQDGLVSQSAASCIATGTTNPEPRPGSTDELLRHTYRRTTTDTVTVGVSGLCSPFSGQERASVTITVLPADEQSPEPVDASRLLGVWDVEGKGATLTLAGEEFPSAAGRLEVGLPCGQVSGGWGAASAQQLFLAYVFSGDQGCLDELREGGPDWLRAAAGYRERDGGRDLLDADGTVVARLLPKGTARAATAEQRESWGAPADLPPGVVPVTRAELLGTWKPLTDPSGKAFVRFDPDGGFGGSDGCNGAGGRWALGAQGRFVGLGGISTLVGCAGSNVPHDVPRGMRAGLDNGQLVLVDVEGREVVRLQP